MSVSRHDERSVPERPRRQDPPRFARTGEKGKAGGGRCYGYDVVKRTDSEGEPVRGERKINEAEARLSAVSSGSLRLENRRAPSRPI